jgi:hypothetical protein
MLSGRRSRLREWESRLEWTQKGERQCGSANVLGRGNILCESTKHMRCESALYPLTIYNKKCR